MRPGQLRHRVSIQDLVNIQGTHGGVDPTWVTRDTVWARIEPLKGREFWQANQINSSISFKVTTRYFQNITTRNQLLFGSRVFKIHAVINPDERSKELILYCEEVLSSDD